MLTSIIPHRSTFVPSRFNGTQFGYDRPTKIKGLQHIEQAQGDFNRARQRTKNQKVKKFITMFERCSKPFGVEKLYNRLKKEMNLGD